MIPPGRVLGVDLGSKRIGVAVTDSEQRVATRVTVLTRTGDRAADHQALADLVTSYEAVGMVVGLPLSLSGQMGPAAAGRRRRSGATSGSAWAWRSSAWTSG